MRGRWGIIYNATAATERVGAEPALVELKTKAQTGSQITSTNVNITGVTEGNLIVVVIAASAVGLTFTVSASGEDFAQDVISNSGGAPDVSVAIWSAPNFSGGDKTITLQVSQLEFVRYAIIEFENVAASGHVIDTNTGQGLTQNATVGSVTTGLSNTLLFGAIRTDGDETAHGDIGVGPGFTLVYAFAASEPEQKLMTEYAVVDAGTYPPGNLFTMQTADGGGWRTALVAYAGS